MNAYRVIIVLLSGFAIRESLDATSYHDAWEATHDFYFPHYEKIYVIPERIIQ